MKSSIMGTLCNPEYNFSVFSTKNNYRADGPCWAMMEYYTHARKSSLI